MRKLTNWRWWVALPLAILHIVFLGIPMLLFGLALDILIWVFDRIHAGMIWLINKLERFVKRGE